jgi:GR25 family glycosyltransferase involved in LPS biosynthesis
MSQSPFDFFDAIFCICAPDRREQGRKARNQFKELGILDRVTFFDAIMTEPYWIGCRESHRGCIKQAQDNGNENVLIFEEDFFFLHKDFVALDRALNDLNRFDWEIFSLGLTVHKVYEHISDNLCLTKGNLTHAAALHKRCWNEILDFPDTEECVDVPVQRAGPLQRGGRGVFNKSNIDIYTTQNFKKYMIKPIMAIQPDKADITLTKYYNQII